MKKLFMVGIGVLIVFFIIFLLFLPEQHTIPEETVPSLPSKAQPSPTSVTSLNEFQAPLPNAKKRVTKKEFGRFVTPQNSPVQPERFYGYHTGSDFEVFPNELNQQVDVKAVCSGNLILKEYASGYGGVAVQSCILHNQPITIIYGHLKLTSIQAAVGTRLSTGEFLGSLGADHSTETDGERKHLHLGFHKGEQVDIKGYVNTQAELASWLNPCDYVCK